MSEINFVKDIKEIDNALGTKLQGMQVEGKEVPVTYASPDVDFLKEDPPVIAFYRTEPFYDAKRTIEDQYIYDNPVYDSDEKLYSLDRRLSPEPWTFLYVVRFKYEYTEDSSTFNMFIRKTFPKLDSFLMINGRRYNVEFVSQSLPMSGYKDFGKTEDGDRSFQEQVVLRVEVALDLFDRETVRVSQETNVNINNS